MTNGLRDYSDPAAHYISDHKEDNISAKLKDGSQILRSQAKKEDTMSDVTCKESSQSVTIDALKFTDTLCIDEHLPLCHSFSKNLCNNIACFFYKRSIKGIAASI